MRIVPAALLAVALAASAAAENKSTYQSLWDSVSARSDCTPQDDVDLTIVACSKDYSQWYFTKAGHPAHPGVVERLVVEDNTGVSIKENGWSFASDADQPAFKTFLAQIRALDAQMKESMSPAGQSPPERIANGGNTQADPRDIEAVVFLTRYYFKLEDSGQLADAYLLFDPGLTAHLSFAEYSAEHAQSSVGAVTSRTIKDIDWEKDAPQGPPGTYAAVDYTAETEHGQLCGYVVWRKQPDNFFILVREERNELPSSLSASALAQFKAKLHCAE